MVALSLVLSRPLSIVIGEALASAVAIGLIIKNRKRYGYL